MTFMLFLRSKKKLTKVIKMPINSVPPGKNPPYRMNAIIEVPKGGRVKYEIDKKTGLLVVDRILHTPLAYPTDYGYFPGTLGDDGDPLDCVVVCSAPLRPGVMIAVRPVGVLLMEDQAGGDEKIICVPKKKIDPFHAKISEIEDLPISLKAEIEYFFKHYKDLESASKWSRVHGWANQDKAYKIIKESIERYKSHQ